MFLNLTIQSSHDAQIHACTNKPPHRALSSPLILQVRLRMIPLSYVHAIDLTKAPAVPNCALDLHL